MPDVCRTCKAPVLWTLTPAGAKAPIDRDGDREKGNTLLLQTAALPRQIISIVLSGDALELARRSFGPPLHTNHWATCPDREQWRAETDAKRAASGDGRSRVDGGHGRVDAGSEELSGAAPGGSGSGGRAGAGAGGGGSGERSSAVGDAGVVADRP